MSGSAITEERNIANELISGLANMKETPTCEQVEMKAQQIAELFGYTGDLRNIITEAMISVDTRMGAGVSLVDPAAKHDDQWVRKREDMIWTYANAYGKFLREERWPPRMVQSLSDVTGRILGHLQDPKSEGTNWNRRGLVIGHVQSGKTANYTGLIARAADAGYKFIIVVAGIHNNLRKQTQQRIDEAFIGRSSDPKDRRNIGVGLAPSWATILRKRENYRRAFDGFDPVKIAQYDQAKVAALLADSGIVRNRAKVAAAIQNAKAYLALTDDGPSFSDFLWRFVDDVPIQNQWTLWPRYRPGRHGRMQ